MSDHLHLYRKVIFVTLYTGSLHFCPFLTFSLFFVFLDKELVITIYSKAAQEEFCVFIIISFFSLRTKVYKMRFDSSTFYSIIGVVPFSRKQLHSTSVLSSICSFSNTSQVTIK